MPGRVVDRLASLVSPGATIAIMGITYKADVDDVRESPALHVAQRAVDRGYDVRLCDPHVAPSTPGLPAPLHTVEQAVRDAEAILLLVDHAEFKSLDPALLGTLVARKQVLDTRAALDAKTWMQSGFDVVLLGSGANRIPAPLAGAR
jgi:UDP-N-acetyl-D-mannosaminuronic acid dehydrogenase